MRSPIVILLVMIAGCFRASAPSVLAAAIPPEGFVCITPSRAEIAFSLAESVVPPTTTHLGLVAMWLSAGGRIDRGKPDALRAYTRGRDVNEALTIDRVRGRPLQLTTSVGGEPPGAATLRDSVGFVTARDGHLVFVVEGEATLASVFATAPDSVMMVADFHKVRTLPVQRVPTPSRCEQPGR